MKVNWSQAYSKIYTLISLAHKKEGLQMIGNILGMIYEWKDVDKSSIPTPRHHFPWEIRR